jgi:membrane-associated phospholipid phosphatase
VSESSERPDDSPATIEQDATARLWPWSVRNWLAHLRSSRVTWIRIGLSLSLLGVSVLTNRSFVGWGLFVIFAIMIVPIGRARSFLLSFVPYAAIWFIFTALRSLSDETILAQTLNLKVAQLERWLFNGQYPTVMWQDRLFDPNHLHWYDYFLTSVHWSYFIIPHLVAIRIWQKNSALFRHYLSAMTLLLAVGLCIYFLIPSNPPWLAPEPVNSPSAAVVYRVMETIARELGGGIYQASYKVIGESNAIAAMPSIHMAITFLMVFPAFHAGKRWGIAALAYSALMGIALVYLGEHYVVDVTVGCIVTTYAWVASGVWLKKVAPAISFSFARPWSRTGAPAGQGSVAD